MKLIVGKESTWSLRVWICGQLANIDFNIKVIDLTDSDYKAQVFTFSPSGLVPALINDSLVVHDSLAIVEYLNEQASGALFPDAFNERAIARSLCSELHSGFMNLREQCSFTLEKVMPLSTLNDGIKNEVSRIETIFEQAQLPYMFEKAGAIDAFYSILAYRLNAYGIVLNGKAGDYQQSLLNWRFLQDAFKEAKVWESK